MIAAACLLAIAPPPARAAQTPGSAVSDPNALTRPPQLDRAPANHVRTARQVLLVAERLPDIRGTLHTHPRATCDAFLKGPLHWQVSCFAKPRRGQIQGKEIGQVLIDDRSGVVLEHWTGFQVAWTMARGYPGAFGRKAGALYVWLPLCVLFLVPFVDPRRPLRLLHLDLLALLGFSVSLAFFDHANIGLSVPLAYPPLVYLLVRMLMVARRRAGGPAEPLRLLVPTAWLAIALIFLVGFRVGLNVTNSNVIDVGYAGVIGADRLADGTTLYGHFPADNQHGDTYGPVNYYAYVPFEQTWPWSGTWDDLPAAHGAAVAFDLLILLGLWLLGRRLRGPRLGWVLAYAWAAFPFTLYTANSNSNDGLVALLITLALLVAHWAPARGAVVALAGLTKFAPLALAPVFATAGPAGVGLARRVRGVALFALAFAVTSVVVMLPVLVGGDLNTFYERTIEFQRARGSPFSVWGFYGWDAAQSVVQAGGLAFAVVAAFLPRRRDLVGLSALAAAVVIVLQLGVTHWFYLYIVWFLPLVLVALLARYREPLR